MSGGGIGPSNNPNKIKGRKWTVFRFFLVSVAYTAGWMAISSELAYYKQLFGPQVLLLMNIAYFLPSIPLLVVSSLLDDYMNNTFGVAKTIFARLLIGLGGCGLICAVFPYQPQDIRFLLGSVTVLGLMAGVAFSASYQMVARFANKNTISLGLGCVGSGILVLLDDVILENVSSEPLGTRLRYGIITGFVLLGFLAANSLLLRHWSAIENYSLPSQEDEGDPAEEPLLKQEEARVATTASDLFTPRLNLVPAFGKSWKKSISATVVGFSPLDPFGTVSEGDSGCDAESFRPLRSRRTVSVDEKSAAAARIFARNMRRAGSTPERASFDFGDFKAPGAPTTRLPEASSSADDGPEPISGVQIPTVSAALSPFAEGSEGEGAGSEGDNARGETLAILAAIWPATLALFLTGIIFTLTFPFFTYVPSSGLFGGELPKVLFFVRLFADIAGRMAPRVKAFSVHSPYTLLALTFVEAATIPVFFLYLKDTFAWRSDLLVSFYVVFLWAAGGYVNTGAYVVAPLSLPAALRARAAGYLAIAYQAAHCVGLLLATVIAAVAFGGIGPAV